MKKSTLISFLSAFCLAISCFTTSGFAADNDSTSEGSQGLPPASTFAEISAINFA